MEITEAPPTLDLVPETGSFRTDLIEGLQQTPKTIPCKYLYDVRGSELFDRICTLEAYYPTRTEVGILRAQGPEIAARIGPRALVVAYGSGSSRKARLLLDTLEAPAGFVPIDISRAYLEAAAQRLSAAYPALPIRPICADYTADVRLPDLGVPARRTLIFFPGSTIGNFEPEAACTLLRRMARTAGADGSGLLLIGVDLKKDRATLETAYDDPQGVTAAFNKNLLRRANREAGADFDIDRFAHRACYNASRKPSGCVEMHLVSCATQEVHVGDATISFDEGESIRTERSYKYRVDEFSALAARAGFKPEAVWTDDAGLFSVHLLAVPAA